MSEELTEAEQWFYDWAPMSYNPREETEHEGKVRGARALAHAEREALSRGWVVEVTTDPDSSSDGDGDTEAVSAGSAVRLVVYLWDREDSRCFGSIGGIVAANEDDSYVRVVAAELAENALRWEDDEPTHGDIIGGLAIGDTAVITLPDEHESRKAAVFGEMVRIGAPIIEHYRGDLWHDALALDAYLPEDSDYAFYWSVGDCGTHYSPEQREDMRAAVANNYGHYAHFHFAIAPNERGRLVLTITRVESPSE